MRDEEVRSERHATNQKVLPGEQKKKTIIKMKSKRRGEGGWVGQGRDGGVVELIIRYKTWKNWCTGCFGCDGGKKRKNVTKKTNRKGTMNISW